MIDEEKLKKWSKEIYDNAVAHGWHEEQHSEEHYLGLIMTEVAEAVKADRNGKRANMPMFEKESQTPQPVNHKKDHWKFCFELFVKNSIEDEFADIVIRLLDMAYALHGESMSWETYPGVIPSPRKYYSFVKNAWNLVSLSLDKDPCAICGSIDYVYKWAEILDIDLDMHIELKMKYNAMREHKHGNKKY